MNLALKKNKTKYKRGACKANYNILSKSKIYYGLTELPKKLKDNNNFIYLLDIIDKFSKYDISIPLENKEANTIFKKFKNCFRMKWIS